MICQSVTDNISTWTAHDLVDHHLLYFGEGSFNRLSHRLYDARCLCKVCFTTIFKSYTILIRNTVPRCGADTTYPVPTDELTY